MRYCKRARNERRRNHNGYAKVHLRMIAQRGLFRSASGDFGLHPARQHGGAVSARRIFRLGSACLVTLNGIADSARARWSGLQGRDRD